MSRLSLCALLAATVCAVLVVPAHGQAVISTRSGVVHYFEGAVSVSGQPLQSRFGRFEMIPDGAELTTAQGKAEVLLTPGVVLRVGENSAIRMLATPLSDTRVELLAGSAMLESAEPAAGTAVTLVYKDWKVQMPHQGGYRIDADPPRLQVRDGEAKVSNAAAGDPPVLVEQGMELPFAAVLAPDKTLSTPQDGLAAWADGRSQSITADNSIAANIQDPADLANPYGVGDDFTYFPMLGYPVMGMGTTVSSLTSPGIYGAAPVYQPGFYSMYMPGYTYRPLYLHLPTGTGLGLGHTLYPPLRVGTPALTLPYRPVTPRPITPIGIRPATTVAPHPVVIHK